MMGSLVITCDEHNFIHILKLLIIDSWTVKMNKFIVLPEIHIITFILTITVISVDFVFLAKVESLPRRSSGYTQ